MHYVDEGPAGAEAVLLLHGQPTWSYLYRTVVARLAGLGLRAVAPDLIGFGRSDKPVARTAHTVQAHVDWVAEFVAEVGLPDLTLVVQDWGGPIGLGVLAARPGLVRRVVAANTALHTADPGLAGRLAWACHAGPDGTVTVEQMLLDYQRLTQELSPFRPSLFVQGATASDVPGPVLAAYDAPLPRRVLLRRAAPASPPHGPHPGQRVRTPEPPHDGCPAALRRAAADGVLRRRSRDPRLGRGAAGAGARRGRAAAMSTIDGAGHFLQEDRGIRAGRRRGAVRGGTPPPDYEAGVDSLGLGRRRRGQRIRLGRGAGPQLGLERRQLVVDLGVLPDLVELLLDVVGAAADVLEDAGLEQLVERARAGLHGGDLVLRPLQRRHRSR